MKVTARQEIGCPSEPLIDSSRMCHNRCSGCQQTLQRDGCFSGIASASGTFLYRQPLERSGAVINLSFSYPLLKSFYFIIYNFSIGIFLKSYDYLSFQSFTNALFFISFSIFHRMGFWRTLCLQSNIEEVLSFSFHIPISSLWFQNSSSFLSSFSIF